MESNNHHSTLRNVLPEHKTISQAPSSLPSGIRFGPYDDPCGWVKAEQQARYKSVDAHGNIYLVMNPIVWPWRLYPKTFTDGRGERRTVEHYEQVMPNPELVLTAEQAKKALRGSSPLKPALESFSDTDPLIVLIPLFFLVKAFRLLYQSV